MGNNGCDSAFVATAKAVDYSLTRFLEDGDLPIDNNWAENGVRPIALGRQNWLFAGSLRAGNEPPLS